jgi:N-acetylglucosaminyldiphosphoundecaprenol N-acetyl-beta-D-mannosaminyltransferase
MQQQIEKIIIMEISCTTPIQWPVRYDIFGVMVSATDYKEAEDKIIAAAVNKIPAIIDHMPVYLLMAGVSDIKFREALNNFDIVAPDGHPVRWALNSFYKLHLKDRVYGPDLMLMLCKRASRAHISIYLYGSTPFVLEALKKNLTNKFPGLIVAGAESPPFRKLTDEEDNAVGENK